MGGGCIVAGWVVQGGLLSRKKNIILYAEDETDRRVTD